MRARIAKWLALFVLLLMAVPANTGIGLPTAYADSQTFEAEAPVNALSGNASVVACSACSGGKKVGGLYQGSTLQFNGITVNEAGSYRVTVSYISGDPRSVNISVNGGSAENYDFPKTADWNTVATFDVTLQLTAGANSIVFADGNWYSPDIDKIVIAKATSPDPGGGGSGGTGSPPANAQYYEAESNANLLSGKASVSNCGACSGGKKVGNLYQGSSLQFNQIEVNAPGTYTVRLYYISGDPRSLLVSSNGAAGDLYDLPKTKDWNTVGTFDVDLSLAAGSNTILMSDGNSYSPDIDKIAVWPKLEQDPGDPDTGGAGSLGDPVGSTAYGSITVTRYTYGATFSNGDTTITYHTDSGLADYAWNNARMVKGVYGSLQLGGLVTSKSYAKHTIPDADIAAVHDGFGDGIRFTAVNETPGQPSLRQIYTLYQGKSYFLTRLEAVGSLPMTTNNMAPVVVSTSGGVDIGSYTDNRVLFVPFDNDNWIRYKAQSINTSNTGYEVTAVYDNANRNGLIIGSVTHDTWKTGIAWSGFNNKLSNLTVYGGASSNITHDSVPHGSISGTELRSPTVFVGYFADYRSGLEEYGRANAVISPPLSFNSSVPHEVPVGWNSWGAYGSKLSYQDVIDTSNYFKANLQDHHFNNDGTLYINLDSYWDNLTDAELQNAVATIRRNGQQAGIYWAPFVYWGNNMSQVVEGTNNQYTYGDIVLKDSAGNILPTLDGAYALDPTHPGTKARIDYYLGKFKALGFTYIKLDFLTHGSLEGKHADPSATTGIQAYNQGMAYVKSVIGGSMFISESIAPLFPSQYAHSRRISTDVYGKISETEYELNSLTYGWWQNGTIYPYTDPDHMVLSRASTVSEARSRVNSAVISGTVFLNSDDVHDAQAQGYMNELLTNEEVNRVARLGKAFQAVEGNTGASAADTFVLNDNGTYYVAVFNYSSASSMAKSVDLARAGLSGSSAYLRTDLWTGAEDKVSGAMQVNLQPAESKLFKLQLDLIPPTTTVAVDGVSGSNVFTNKDVTLTFTAADQPGGTGVLLTEISVNGGDWTTIHGPVTLTEEGMYQVDYRSKDRYGNAEATKRLTVGIDRTAPVVRISGPLTVWQTDPLNLPVSISDSLSGVSDSTVKLDGTIAGNPLQADPATLAAGNHVIEVTAEDLAGNVTANTYTLKVSIDTARLKDLIRIGVRNGSISDANWSQSLLAKADKPGSLTALRNEAEAQSGKKIGKAFADLLIADIDFLLQADGN